MSGEDLALFTALDRLGTWITIDDGPAAFREDLIAEFQRSSLTPSRRWRIATAAP